MFVFDRLVTENVQILYKFVPKNVMQGYYSAKMWIQVIMQIETML